MSLTIVSTPIGDFGDITLRAIETLKNCDLIICEELKPARVLLKRIGLEPNKEMFQLNEHSRAGDLAPLVQLCREKNVALISDCGTPGFCDPGADLIEACRKEGITLDVNPGASSLMALLSMSGEMLREFHFVGFLPSEKTDRAHRIEKLAALRIPFVIMDTPYRLKATVQELATRFGTYKAVLGVDITGEKHQIHKGRLAQLGQEDWPKAPFVLLCIPG